MTRTLNEISPSSTVCVTNALFQTGDSKQSRPVSPPRAHLGRNLLSNRSMTDARKTTGAVVGSYSMLYTARG